MNDTIVTTPHALEIRVERIFDAPRAHVFSVWTDPKLIPEWWGEGTVVEEMDVRAGGTYRFRTAFGVVEGEFREVDAPERLVQTFQNHLQTLEFEDLGDRTKLTQTMRPGVRSPVNPQRDASYVLLRKSSGQRRRNHARRRRWRATRMPTITTTMAMSANGHIGWYPLMPTGKTIAKTMAPRTRR